MNTKEVKIGTKLCRILPEYPDYAISKSGVIYSRYKKPYWRVLSGKRIKNNGYSIISVRTNEGVKKTYGIHQLVAIAWVPNPDSKPFVGHLDNDRLNNKASNLYWCTARENTGQCIRDNRFYKPPLKASKKEIREIRNLHEKNGLTYYRLSKIYGYSQITIKKYCTISN